MGLSYNSIGLCRWFRVQGLGLYRDYVGIIRVVEGLHSLKGFYTVFRVWDSGKPH